MKGYTVEEKEFWIDKADEWKSRFQTLAKQLETSCRPSSLIQQMKTLTTDLNNEVKWAEKDDCATGTIEYSYRIMVRKVSAQFNPKLHTSYVDSSWAYALSYSMVDLRYFSAHWKASLGMLAERNGTP